MISPHGTHDITPTVLKISPHMHYDIPTVLNTPNGTAHPHGTAHMLYRVIMIDQVLSGQLTIICSVGEELVMLSIEVPRQRFWLPFTFLLQTISGLINNIPLIRTKISLLWDLN